MKTKIELKSEIENLNEQINECLDQFLTLFKIELNNLLKKYELDSVRCSVNNHDFNDGELTHFSLYYDCEGLTITQNNGEELQNTDPIYKEFVAFFKYFDVEDLYENEFDNLYNEITFKPGETLEIE